MNESKNPQCVFLDTNVLVALYNKKDLLHQEALKIFKTLSAQKARLVVSNYVLLEIYTILSQRAGKKKAIEFGTMVRIINCLPWIRELQNCKNGLDLDCSDMG